MDNTTVNGIVLDDSISNCLLKLQNNRAASLAELLDDRAQSENLGDCVKILIFAS